jgi:hypothetical protein
MRLFPLIILFVLISCSSKVEKTEQPDELVEQITLAEVEAVCIWDKVSVRAEPSANGKWMTSISIGETLVYLGVEAIDSVDKNRKYYNVKLADGTEGWSLADFIVPEGKVGVFLDENYIYNRPDLLTKTENKFSMMDIVAIKSTQDDWLEVEGKRNEGSWIESGWVKGGNISQESLDVAVAKFAKIAFDESNIEAQVESLKEILENTDFSNSAFIPMVQSRYDELTTDFEVEEAGQDMDSLEVSED